MIYRTLESQQSLSSSCLWQLQREYFERQGIEAWSGQVPFYVTSNPFIAETYAEMLVAAIRDVLQHNPEAAKHPFYVVELGTGAGQFSFYFLKRLEDLRQLFSLTAEIVYIMSDFTDKNIEFWQQQHQLKSFAEQGVLDFAKLDLTDLTSITLVKRQQVLDSECLYNPLFIVANYIFDTIAHDAFYVKDGQISPALVTVKTDTAPDEPIELEELKVEFEPQAPDINYYQNPELNKILQSYQQDIVEGYCLMPIEALQCLQFFWQLTKGKFAVIASDKGYSHVDQMQHLIEPHIAFHGSFSLMVNFDAIAKYFVYQGGQALLQSERRGLSSGVFLGPGIVEQMGGLHYVFDLHMEQFGPAEYFLYHRYLSDTFEKANLSTLLAHLHLAKWDPYMFFRLSKRIQDLLLKAATVDKLNLYKNLHKVVEKFYFLSENDGTLFEVGLCYHLLEDYQAALQVYLLVYAHYPKTYHLVYNLGLCHSALGDDAAALDYFKQAFAIRPDSRDVLDWISKLS